MINTVTRSNTDQPVLYMLLKGVAVVYVGQTKDIYSRLWMHMTRENKDWDVAVTCHVDCANINEAETWLIANSNPSLNVSRPQYLSAQTFHTARPSRPTRTART